MESQDKGIKEEEKDLQTQFVEGIRGMQQDAQRELMFPPENEEEQPEDESSETDTDDDGELNEEEIESKGSKVEKGLLKALQATREKLGKAEPNNIQNQLKAIMERLDKVQAQAEKPKSEWDGVTDEQIEDAIGAWKKNLRAAERALNDDEINYAESAILQLEREQRKRNRQPKEEPKHTQATHQDAEQLDAIRELGLSALPQMNDKNSTLYKKSSETFFKFPVLEKMGNMGALLATALTVIQNPELVAGKVNKQITNKLQQAAEETLTNSGSGTAPKKPAKKLSHQENIELAEKIKMGQASFS